MLPFTLLIGLVGCGGGDRSSGPYSGGLVIFAAASLTGPFQAAKAQLGRQGTAITFDFGGSNTLATQLAQGAPGDVFAAADEATMAKVEQTRTVEHATVFATNRLMILVPPGNPRHVTTLADLARRDVAVVLAAPEVPAGRYAAQILARSGVRVEARSLEPDVKAAVAKVLSGEADATVVYTTDVRAVGRRGTGVPIPEDQNVLARYPIAVVHGTRHAKAAQAWITSAREGLVRRALDAAGFGGP